MHNHGQSVSQGVLRPFAIALACTALLAGATIGGCLALVLD